MPQIRITVSDLQKEFLEQKSEECGCSEEEFIDILISRDMKTDCRYIEFLDEGAGCSLDGDCCNHFIGWGSGPEWLRGHECEKVIDYKGDLSDLDKQRGI